MKKQIFLTFVFCLPFLPLFSSSINLEEKVSEVLINEILPKAPNTVERVDDERLYLKNEYISIKDKRILLKDPNGCKIELPSISCEPEGLYVLAAQGQLLVYECTRCHEIYGGHPGVCDRCGGTSFIRKYVPISRSK